MSAGTLEEIVRGRWGMTVADAAVLLSMYGPVEDLWEEEGVVAAEYAEDLALMLIGDGVRVIPEYFLGEPGWREREAADEAWWAEVTGQLPPA